MRTPILYQIKKGERRQGAELTKKDIGCLFDLAGFGKVLPIDVGKRVWARSYGIAMENDEQRDARKLQGMKENDDYRKACERGKLDV
jgi:hypothetical protein